MSKCSLVHFAVLVVVIQATSVNDSFKTYSESRNFNVKQLNSSVSVNKNIAFWKTHKHLQLSFLTHKRHTPSATQSHSFEFEGKKIIVDLIPNEELIPTNFTITTYTKNGKPQTHQPTTNKKICHYQGKVRGIKGSRVIASNCHGLQGIIVLPNDYLKIQSSKHGISFIHRPTNFSQTERKHYCGTNYHRRKRLTRSKAFNSNDAVRVDPGISLQQKTPGKKFVELMMIANNRLYNQYKKKVTERIKDIINHVDSYYKQFNIRVILYHIEVWNTKDQILSSTNSNTLLYNLFVYRKYGNGNVLLWKKADAVHLLSGYRFDENIYGLSYVDNLCSAAAAGVDRNQQRIDATASTVAHELGHNFGMVHDDPAKCQCSRIECVMASHASFSNLPPPWSSCSREILENLNKNQLSCLSNIPSQMFFLQTCGNDIVEIGEECDCGYQDDCENQCCDAASCQLLPGASCYLGPCCSNCKIITNISVCRKPNSECELSEYCDGKSSFCPKNLYKIDGTKCLNDTGICWQGICHARDLRCFRCSDGKVCKNGRCVSINFNCSKTCNGNGVCNNFGHCHCNEGWSPPFCNKSGLGASVDSGLYDHPNRQNLKSEATTSNIVVTAKPSTISSNNKTTSFFHIFDNQRTTLFIANMGVLVVTSILLFLALRLLKLVKGCYSSSIRQGYDYYRDTNEYY